MTIDVIRIQVPGPQGPPTIAVGSVITTEGSIPIGGTGGVPEELPGGNANQELAMVNGRPAWRDKSLYDVRDFGAVCDGTTDDRAAILAAITAANGSASGGGTVLVVGKCAFTGVIQFQSGVNLQGVGTGRQLGEGTQLICLDSTAQIKFGDQTTPQYGGVIGNFTIDADSVATNPLSIGIMVGVAFAPMYVISAAAGGTAVKVAGAQNCTFMNLRVESCDGDGLVFDLGAGGNNLYGLGIADIDGWSVKFVQTGASHPGVYVAPSDNRIFGFMVESFTNSSLGLVYQGAGVDNLFDGGVFALSQVTSARDIAVVNKDDPGLFSTIIFRTVKWFGVAAYVTGVKVNAASTAVFEGMQTPQLLLRMMYVKDGTQIFDTAQWNIGAITRFVSQDATVGAEGLIVRNRSRSVLEIVRPLATDMSILLASSSSANYMYIDAQGTINWNNDTSQYRYGAAAIGFGAQLIPTGSITIKTKAGIPTDADTTVDLDGTMVMDTTNHRLYVRSGGVWKYAALT